MSSDHSLLIDSRLPFLPGLRVAIKVQGEGDPVLLINGMSRPLQSWDTVANQLHGRTVVSFDAPGVGDSPTTIRPVSIVELATVAVTVLDAVGLDDADVVGFSHGGAVAQQLAHADPGRVGRLVLASTSCGVGSTPGRTRDIRHSLSVPMGGLPWPLADPLGLFWQSLAVSSWSSIPFLGGIKAATLVVCGSRDRVVPPCNSRVLARRIPNARLVMLPERGHDLQRGESAKELAHTVETFLSNTRAPERR